MKLDLYLFKIISGPSGRVKILDILAIFLAKYLPFILFACLFVFSLFKKDINIFLIPVFVGVLARAFNQIIFTFYQRKRPFDALNLAPLVKKPNYPAFPSSHSAFFFALSFSLLAFNYQLSLVFLFCTCLIVFSRVYCRLHWPSDILAGFLMGLFSFLVSTKL